jgi:mono/diheme cytochrome c family protein
MYRPAWLAAVSIALAVALAWAISAPQARFTPEQWEGLGLTGDAVAGRLVFFEGGCDSCHMKPGQTDPMQLGGGLELKTPFGSFYPPNISTDPDDGIGRWRSVDLANALLAGVSPKAQHYYPALPYPSYRHMDLKDVADLMAFLRTAPPIKGRAPAHSLAFPFSIRRGIGFWKLLFLDDPIVASRRNQDPQWRRGEYLVDGPGHCGECHTPRNWMGAMKVQNYLEGGHSRDKKGDAPSLVSGDFTTWSREDIVTALTGGFTPVGDVLGGEMTSVVRNLARLPQADREAIAIYLKSSHRKQDHMAAP